MFAGFPVGEGAGEEFDAVPAMVGVDQVAEFVGDDVVNRPGGGPNQISVEDEGTGSGEAAPAAGEAANVQGWGSVPFPSEGGQAGLQTIWEFELGAVEGPVF